MQYRPEAKDILVAVQDLLMKELLPKLEGEELLSYKTLVSWNMLGVLVRELDKEDEFINVEYESLETIKSLKLALSLSQADFKVLARKEKETILRSLNKDLAEKIRISKLSTINSDVWKHLKLTLKNNLAVSNSRFVT
jgi:hypothetical protein